MRQISPDHEEFWFETYGRVAKTGESVRFENRAEAMGKWFEAHAFRIGGEGSREVGILFKDVSERRRSEAERDRLLAEAREREAFLELITDRLPVRIGYLGPDYRYRYLNGAYERAFGITKGRGIGMSVAELAGEEAFGIAKPFLDRAFAGDTHTQEFSVPYAFGERRVEVQYNADPDEDGTVRGVVVHVLDVTARFEAERAVAAERARQDRILETAQVATFEWDVPADRIHGNALLHRFFGIVGADGEGQRLDRYFAAIHPDDRERVAAALARSHGSGEPYEVQYRVSDAEGRSRWVLTRGDTALGEDGKAFRTSGVVLDVTEAARTSFDRERLLSELRAEREKLDTVLHLSPSFVTILRGESLTFELANPAYERAVGRTGLVGRTLAEALPEVVSGGAQGQEYDRFLRRTMAEGETIHFRWQPIQLETSPGKMEQRILDFTYQPLRDADGKATGVLVHGTDVTDRARAERALAEREELFRTVFEGAADDAILVMDADRALTAWNPAAERIAGWAAEEAVGRSADLIFTPEDRTAGVPDAEADNAAREGKAEDERWHLRKDGSRFWGSGTMNALHADDGGVRGFLKVFRDATARYEETQTLAFLSLLTEAVIDQREPERILETVERMLGRYLGAARVAFAEVAADGESFTVRQEWAPDRPSLVGNHRLSDFGPVVGAALRAGRTHVSRDAAVESRGDEAVRRFGIESGITVPVIAEGRLASFVVVHGEGPRDWTDDEQSLVRQIADRVSSEIERARAEAALRTSEGRFRQLVDLSPSTVWFGEVDGGLSYISRDFYESTGLTPEEALPNGWASTVHPDDLLRVAEAWTAARRDETTYDTEFRIRNREGDYRWLSARAVPLRDEQGRVTGWLGSNSDIQAQKETEETLKARVDERTEELQRTVREAEGFNYSISHDLRTPLRAMVATASILLEELGSSLDEEHRALLVRQADNAKRLGRLIDELLRLSRLARVEVNRQALDMSAMARSVFDEIGTHEETNGCLLQIQPGMTAEGDSALVRTVLHNLLGNACKFSPQGGTIRFCQEGRLFSVADEGVGFDMQFAPKIFLPFERLVSDVEFEGTGIGLANVKRIVERHGGRVWVQSAPGAGTTFFFTLAS